MKKIILSLTVIIVTTSVFGQITTPDTLKKEYRNIIEIDATRLLSQFFNFNSSYYYYNNKYMINYKRIIRSNALRAGINADFDNYDEKTNDTIYDNSKRNNILIGLGIEHYSYLSKNLSFYAGADIIAEYFINDRKYSYYSNSNSKYKTETYSIGISPLFGIVFRLNQRLSLSTETSFDILYHQSFEKRTYFPNIENNQNTKTTGYHTQFYAPTFINFRIKF